MGSPSETLASAKTPDKLVAADDAGAKALERIGLPIRAFKIDIGKTQDAMTKSKKPADFVLAYDNKKLTYELRIASDKTVLDTLDIAGERDVFRRRQWIVVLKTKTKLVTAADLAAYDRANPVPVSAQEEKIKKEIEQFELVIQAEENNQVNYAKKYAEFDWQQRRLDFLPWAKAQGHEAAAQFMIAVTDKFNDHAIMTVHVSKGAKLPIKISDSIRKPMEEAFARKTAVNFGPAKTEVLKLVDGTLMPKFRAQRLEKGKAHLVKSRQGLAKSQADLAKLRPK